jgi:hypothetical protein
LVGKLNEERFIFCDITLCSPLKITDVSEEHIASIFRVTEQAKQKTSMKQTASRPKFMLYSGFLLDLFFDPEEEVICASERSADFLWTTRYYIPED